MDLKKMETSCRNLFWIGNYDSWKRYADHAKGIVNADTEEALRLKKMYKEIGL